MANSINPLITNSHCATNNQNDSDFTLPQDNSLQYFLCHSPRPSHKKTLQCPPAPLRNAKKFEQPNDDSVLAKITENFMQIINSGQRNAIIKRQLAQGEQFKKTIS